MELKAIPILPVQFVDNYRLILNGIERQLYLTPEAGQQLQVNPQWNWKNFREMVKMTIVVIMLILNGIESINFHPKPMKTSIKTAPIIHETHPGRLNVKPWLL